MTARRRPPKSPAAKEPQNGHAFAVVVEQLRSQLGVVAEAVLDRPTRSEVETQFAEVREALRDRPTRGEVETQFAEIREALRDRPTRGEVETQFAEIREALRDRPTRGELDERFHSLETKLDAGTKLVIDAIRLTKGELEARLERVEAATLAPRVDG